jgi:hypothetical protein
MSGFYIWLIVVVSIFAIVALREVFCWYYKINKIVELLEKNNRILMKAHFNADKFEEVFEEEKKTEE